MAVPITKCLSRISPDNYLHVMSQIIIAAGCDPKTAAPALDLLETRMMAAGLMTEVREPAEQTPVAR